MEVTRSAAALIDLAGAGLDGVDVQISVRACVRAHSRTRRESPEYPGEPVRRSAT